jgi:nicotinamide mononucleotide transporter
MMIALFDIDNTAFDLWGYRMSHLELYGTIAGIIAVWLSARANIWSWPIGIINVVLSFFLFYQVQLYPDIFLQVFFFITNILGWWRWTHPKPFEEDRKKELKVSFMTKQQLALIVTVGLTGTFAFGLFAKNLHTLLPAIFTKPSAAPFLDSFITVMSIITTFCMIQKKIESWIIWILVDVVATYLYFMRDIKVYSLLYLAFTFIAAFGLYHWLREYKSYRVRTGLID